jgi:hypothetical protein
VTHHDQVRQKLHASGFKPKDGRSALEMTDEEVETFVVAFVDRMVEINHSLVSTFRTLAASITEALEPLRDLGQLLAEAGVHEEPE